MKSLPSIDWEPYIQAEAYLQTELIPLEEAELLAKYRAAVTGRRFGEAVGCLVELGDRQGCSNPYWQALEKVPYPPLRSHDRRVQGQLDALKDYIRRRAKGLP